MTLPALTVADGSEGPPLDYGGYGGATPSSWPVRARRSLEAARRREEGLRAEVRDLQAQLRAVPPEILSAADLAVAWGLPLVTARRLWRARRR